MSRNLCDETFPGSLLIEFDELDDEIPISPELPKRHPHGGFQRHHSTLSGGPAAENVSDKGHADDRNGSRTVISGSSNTSSGHSSLSTEGENRSASSDRDSSRDLSKRQTVPAGLQSMGPARNLLLPAGDKLMLKPRKLRPPRSLESLLQDHSDNANSSLRTASSLGQRTGPDTGRYGAELLPIGGTANRNRTKYGHVQSKVKQLIDEMKPTGNQERKAFVRHKSMPETYAAGGTDEDDELLDQETDVETLKAIVRQMKTHARCLEQQLAMSDVCHTNLFNELATLKCKNSSLRMENDQLLDQERAREMQRKMMRQCDQHAGSCYGSQSSLHKTTVNTCTVAVQTSPGLVEFAGVFDFLASPNPPTPRSALRRSNLSAGRKGGRTVGQHTTSSTIEPNPDSVAGEFSPDYEQLIPMLGQSGESYRQNLRLRDQHPTPTRAIVERSDTELTQEFGNSPGCRDCRKRRKKRKSRKHKLASLFCIRRNDESL